MKKFIADTIALDLAAQAIFLGLKYPSTAGPGKIADLLTAIGGLIGGTLLPVISMQKLMAA